MRRLTNLLFLNTATGECIVRQPTNTVSSAPVKRDPDAMGGKVECEEAEKCQWTVASRCLKRK